MITRLHKFLIGLLVVQVAVAALLLTRSDDTGTLAEKPILAGLDVAKVTRLRVWDKDAAQPAIDLVKRGTSWVLGSHFDYPAVESRVTDVLTPIAKATAASPIATQDTRHRQLRVADKEFERKLLITADGKDLTVYLGSSAGPRRTAIRLGDSADVYAATGINAFGFGAEPQQWVKTTYLEVPKDDIAKVTIARGATSVELVRGAPPAAVGSGSAGSGSAAPAAPTWTAAIGGAPITLAAGETLDTARIDTLVGEAGKVELTKPGDPKRDASHPTATITIERKATSAATPAPTVLDVIADGTSYWVHQRGAPQAVLVDKSRLDSVVELDRDKLVVKPAPPPPPAAGSGAGSAKPPRPATGT